MGQFLFFFLRFRNLLFYLFLLTLSLIYAFQSSNPISNNLTRFSLAAIAPIHRSANSIYGYFGLKKINDSLHIEIRELKEQKLNRYPTPSISSLDSPNVGMDRYRLRNANVIHSNKNFEANFFIIDKGKNDGIKPEMGVIHHDGVLGITRDVSSNFSRVISILHKDVGTSIRNRQTGDVGILKWTLTTSTKMVITDFLKSKVISLNDTIETSGISSFFPASIPLGRITKIDSVRNPIYYRLEVELFEDPFSQRLVYIVEDSQKIEMDSLLFSVE